MCSICIWGDSWVFFCCISHLSLFNVNRIFFFLEVLRHQHGGNNRGEDVLYVCVVVRIIPLTYMLHTYDNQILSVSAGSLHLHSTTGQFCSVHTRSGDNRIHKIDPCRYLPKFLLRRMYLLHLFVLSLPFFCWLICSLFFSPSRSWFICLFVFPCASLICLGLIIMFPRFLVFDPHLFFFLFVCLWSWVIPFSHCSHVC